MWKAASLEHVKDPMHVYWEKGMAKSTTGKKKKKKRSCAVKTTQKLNYAYTM